MSKIRQILAKRIPSIQRLSATFGLILFVIHTWSIWQFLYRVPSYLMYLDIINLLAVFAYYMGFALLESLILLIILIFVAMILPTDWYAINFDAMNLPIVLISAISAVGFQKQLGNAYEGINPIIQWLGSTLLMISCLAILTRTLSNLRNFSSKVMDRISIMIYLYLPIGLFSLLVVMYRNLI